MNASQKCNCFVLLVVLLLGVSFILPHISYLTFSSSPSILISEVYYDTPGIDANEEWIELFNPLDSSVDLTNWVIKDNSYSYTLSSITIAASGYLILARNDTGFYELFNMHANITGIPLSLGNSGDKVELYDASNTLIDFVAWEGEVSGWDISASTGKSIARKSQSDTDTSSDWASNQDPSPYSGMSLDTEPPSISFTNPANQSTVTGLVTVAISATDNVGIKNTSIYLNTTLVSTTTTYSWDTTNANETWYNLTAVAYDYQENRASTTIYVFVNNSAFRSETFKIMTYNVEESGINADWELVVKEENPDIFLAVETGSWDDNNNETFNQYVNDLNTYWMNNNEDPYNWTYVEQGVSWSTQGYAFMSRYEIRRVHDFSYVTLDNGSSYSFDFVDAEIMIMGVTIHVIGAHLKCCAGAEYEARREAQMEGLINYMDSLGDGTPIILMGDFNSFSPEDTDDLAPEGDLGDGPITMLLEPHNTHGSLYHNFTDVYRTLNPTTPGYTYHGSSSLESRIDFIFVNDFFQLGELINSTVGDTAHADTGSDHYSVDAFIQLVQGIDSVPPAPVQNFHASLITPTSITLAWEANTEPDMNHYMIYRNGTFLKNTSLTWFMDTGLPENTTYEYTIYALDFSENLSNATKLLTRTSFLHVPNPPENLAATLGSSSVFLSWTAPTEQGNATVSYYRVYRAINSSTYEALGVTSLTKYTDVSVPIGINITYYVVAVNDKGESTPSNTIQIYIPPATTTTTQTTSTQQTNTTLNTSTQDTSSNQIPTTTETNSLLNTNTLLFAASILALTISVIFFILATKRSKSIKTK